MKAGYTYLFVDHFSGGLGGADRSLINVTYNSPLSNNFNTTTASNSISFTLDDINSTGLNLSLNASINVSIYESALLKTLINYTNSASTSLTCTSSDSVSPENTTSVSCNVTFAFSNGTYVVNVTARDASNNSNPVNATFGSITIRVDQLPPVFVYYNFTNTSRINLSGDAGGDGYELGATDGISRAQGNANTGRLFGTANWTDNLTAARYGLLQFFNQSASDGAGAWQTLNITAVNGTGGQGNGGWTNFSFPIPKGHNSFEGRNVSFRIIANDT
ncbi:hypothetical protein HYX05_02275, partial [Candidatus Woesearchaeota archaeon]|nr:hypothetical protein [Candidatus Woesearchaeota archaeon]